MSTKPSTAVDTSIQQAELILKLYELRRETVMREARSYVGGSSSRRRLTSWSRS